MFIGECKYIYFMSTNKIFYDNLNKIAEISGVESSIILSKSKEFDVVDARHILIKVLYNNGFSTNTISKLLGISMRNVQYAITRFENRIKFSKWARTTYETVTKVM